MALALSPLPLVLTFPLLPAWDSPCAQLHSQLESPKLPLHITPE